VHVGLGTFVQNMERRHDDADVYAHEMALADQAEPLGFDSVWGAEHHFDGYHMMPNVAQFLTWVAGRTERVKLGSMVMVVPWHHPVRLAEEVCVLDQLSRGRVILGLGRGLGRIEFDGFGVEMAESRTRFVEHSRAILQGLETGRMASDGSLYRQSEIELRPGPFASFRGRVYASAISPESARIMAELGIGIMVIAQKPWETTIADVENYRQVYREINGTEAPKPIIATWVAVHDSEEAANELFERHIVGYSQTVLQHYEFANPHLAGIPGYEYYGKLSENVAKHGPDKFARFLAELQVWGTPDQVTERVVENVRRIDAGGVITLFSYGGMPFDTAKANLALFAERVLPALQKIDTGPPIGRA
jgi:alkanesulfonate monooxygenase SsuD/methylene tetrahydromethanopterin reductase-like flavin-dependent oxidoreductase (luciferase family)